MNADKQPTLTAAVTGSTGAIGKATAAGLASHGIRVVLINRDPHKSRLAARNIIKQTGNQQVETQIFDLSREVNILKLKNGWRGPLDVLINNAAVTPPARQETPEGIELQFATNVLGYFWMIQAFQDLLSHSNYARIVNVASYWAGGLDIDDLEFERRPYHNDAVYRQSKQANRMLTLTFAEKLSPLGITVNSCHPGDVNSTLSNDLGFGGSQSPAQAAETPIWLAVSSQVEGVTGKYFERKQLTRCQFASQQTLADKLTQKCFDYTNYLD